MVAKSVYTGLLEGLKEIIYVNVTQVSVINVRFLVQLFIDKETEGWRYS